MLKSIQNSVKFIVGLSLVTLVNAYGSSNPFIKAKVIDNVNRSVMLGIIRTTVDIRTKYAYGYKAVKITYNTVGQNSEPIVASGLLVIPTVSRFDAFFRRIRGQEPFTVAMVNDNHGTMFLNSQAPSNAELTNGFPDSLTAVLLTGISGHATILPDYIGYGDSNDKVHPYLHREVSARTNVDMIKASMKYMQDTGVPLNNDLYISGYSEGGYTAMATAQSVEEGAIANVNLVGVVSMAGPHFIDGMGDEIIDTDYTMPFPALIAYLADSFAYYNDDIVLSDIILEQDTTKYHALFDGSNSIVEVHAALGLTANDGYSTYNVSSIFQESFINDYQENFNNSLKTHFAENKSYSDAWIPKTKINLIHCIDDEIVPFSMSENAYTELSARGADIKLSAIASEDIDINSPLLQIAKNSLSFVHEQCMITSYLSAYKWLDGIKK